MNYKEKRKQNNYIQNNMYQGKHSKSIHKGLKTSLLLLVCMLVFGWLFYQNILQYKAGLVTNSVFYWLYTNISLTILKMLYGLLCVLILIAGIWDVQRLKAIKNNKTN